MVAFCVTNPKARLHREESEEMAQAHISFVLKWNRKNLKGGRWGHTRTRRRPYTGGLRRLHKGPPDLHGMHTHTWAF